MVKKKEKTTASHLTKIGENKESTSQRETSVASRFSARWERSDVLEGREAVVGGSSLGPVEEER